MAKRAPLAPLPLALVAAASLACFPPPLDLVDTDTDSTGDAPSTGPLQTSTGASTGTSTSDANIDTDSSSTDTSSSTGTGTTTTGTTTSASSTGEPAPTCGDGIVNQDSEECDLIDPGPTDPCNTACKRARLIFVTSISINGKMSGLQGANAYCKSQAVKAKMADPASPIDDPGNFKALLSTSTQTVFDLHFVGEGPYRLVNGLTVSDSFAELFSEPLQNPIDVDEFSHSRVTGVWSGTTPEGQRYPGIDFCKDWTVIDGSSNWGASSVIERWIDVGDDVINNPDTPCNADRGLYCVEQQ